KLASRAPCGEPLRLEWLQPVRCVLHRVWLSLPPPTNGLFPEAHRHRGSLLEDPPYVRAFRSAGPSLAQPTFYRSRHKNKNTSMSGTPQEAELATRPHRPA